LTARTKEEKSKAGKPCGYTVGGKVEEKGGTSGKDKKEEEKKEKYIGLE